MARKRSQGSAAPAQQSAPGRSLVRPWTWLRRTPRGAVAAPRPKRTPRQIAIRGLKWLTITGLVGVLIITGGLFFLYQTTKLPDQKNAGFDTQTTFVYYDGGKVELGSFAIQRRTILTLKQIPTPLQNAVIAIENKSFYTDSGIDPKGILRAAFSDARGNATQGGSTITQQYVKILYLNQDRSIKRKLKEAILSLKLQRKLSKKEILTEYLNSIYFGRGAYGVQAASQAYFDKGVGKLNLPQCAVLAAILNNPNQLDPANGKDSRIALLGRYQQVLIDMAAIGKITDAQATKAERHLPKFPQIKTRSTYGGQRGFMLDLVHKELLADGYSEQEINGGGLHVMTTFTRKAMDAAKAGVVEQRPAGFSDKKLHIAVASVEPGTGALRGFYGGQDYLRSEINWATAGGMVGSTFKPFTLATALSNGFALKDTFDGDSPYTFPDGLEVHNEGEGTGENFGQHVNAIYALQKSINTAFVDMSNSIPDGPAKIFKTAERMGIPPADATSKYPGIPSESGVDLSPKDTLITLGKAKLSPINMANAYATIANGGKRADVHVIESVTSPTGHDFHYEDHTTKAISADVAADTSYAMQQVVTGGTGENALALGRPAAGKTGTATATTPGGLQFVSSAWFVGFTPQLSTAVMYVRGKGTGRLDGWLPSYFGADYPTRTWTDVMQHDLDGVDVEDFPAPAYVDGVAPDGDHAPQASYAPTTNGSSGGGGGGGGHHSQPPNSFTPPPIPIHNTPTSHPTHTPTSHPTPTPTHSASSPPTSSAPTSSASAPAPPTPCSILGTCATPTSQPTTSQPTSQPTSDPTHSSSPNPSPSGGGSAAAAPGARSDGVSMPRATTPVWARGWMTTWRAAWWGF